MRRLITSGLMAILLIANHGCKSIDVHGNYISDHQLQKLEQEKQSKEEIRNTLGAPTLLPDFSKNTWYYVSRTVHNKTFSKPKLISQRIVQIEFNKKDLVQEITLLEDIQDEKVVISSDFTEAHGKDIGPLQRFVQNIGRYVKAKDKKVRHGSDDK